MALNSQVAETVMNSIQACAGRLGMPLAASTTLSSLGIGSMALLELATSLEQTLDIRLSIDRVARSRTVGELVTLVSESRRVEE